MFKKLIIINMLFIGGFIQAKTNDAFELIAESNIQIISQKLDGYMQALTALNRFSGAVIVAKGNTVLLNKGYGFASHEFEILNTSQTRFRICSITKMVTALAILQLQERGLLKVSDKLDKYFPDFPRGNEITIHHLLAHTSGISSSNVPYEMVVQPTSLEQLIVFATNKPLEFDPGSDFRYSNAGYFILSALIEKISGKTYESFIKENILAPLNMNESFFRDQDYSILKNCAVGYCMNEANKLVNGHYVYENFKGSGGLFCNAHDLYTFLRVLNKGELINKESRRMMFTSYHDAENYGYGCNVHDHYKHPWIEHGGMLSSGFKSNATIFINDDIYIVVLSNFFSAWAHEAREALVAIMFELPYEFPRGDVIKIDSIIYDDYKGAYDHPAFKEGYSIQKKEDKLYLPNNSELLPVATDQFMILDGKSSHLVYTFIRNEEGRVIQLRIKGGAPYFEVRCEKIG